jgi:hypothetical protein
MMLDVVIALFQKPRREVGNKLPHKFVLVLINEKLFCRDRRARPGIDRHVVVIVRV